MLPKWHVSESPIAVPSEVNRYQQKIIGFSTAQAKEKRCHIIGREVPSAHAEARKLVEETFQLPQCKAENEEDDLPIPESHDDVSETVRQISSNDEEDSVFDFISVFAYNSDGEYIEL